MRSKKKKIKKYLGWPYVFSRLWNRIPYGYLGYRIENKIFEFLYKNYRMKIIKMGGNYYACYFPSGKNEKWWEVKVDGPNSIITLKELMKKKWVTK